MKTKLLQGLLLCVALISASYAEINPRIVGGTESPQAYSWMVSIQGKEEGNHFCGGTLIGSDWVVTAAHCTQGASPEEMQVVIGIQNLDTPETGETFSVKAIYDHNNFNFPKELDNDISLLKLSGNSQKSPLEMISQVNFNKLNEGDLLTVIGWGALSEGGNSPTALNEVQLPLVSPSVCRTVYSNEFDESDTPLCAGYPEGKKDSCQGDSGGPLIVELNGTPYLVGVVSWGYGCAREGIYGIYTNASVYHDWVEEFLSEDFAYYKISQKKFYVGQGKVTTLPLILTNHGTNTMEVTGLSVIEGDDFLILEDESCIGSSLVSGASCELIATVKADQVANNIAQFEVNAETNIVFYLFIESLSPIDFPFLDDLAIDWFVGGDNPWLKVEDSCELVSGSIEDNESSILLGHYRGVDEPLVDVEVSSEDGWDKLYVSIDGDLDVSILSGEVAEQVTFSSELENRDHRIMFVYFKDSTDELPVGSDRAKITGLQLGDTVINSNCNVIGEPRELAEEPQFSLDDDSETPFISSGSGGGSAFYLLLPLLLLNFKRNKAIKK